jgi:antimicrobial peptide system SdpB family protein
MIQNLNPWSNLYGLGRSLMATATFLTLAFNAPSILFRPGVGDAHSVVCSAAAGHISLYCLAGPSHILLVQIGSALVLLVTASGWRPRWTALPHWWVTSSFYMSARAIDGGDQAAATFTLLLLPLALTDDRVWHWTSAKAPAFSVPKTRALFSACALQLQTAGLYLDSCLEKLRVPEWTDGTNLYYVLNNNYFGMPHYLHWVIAPLAASPLVAPITWSVLCLEFLLGINFLLAKRLRRGVFLAAIAFHVGIMLFLGIFTFGVIMVGVLCLGALPIGWSIRQAILGERGEGPSALRSTSLMIHSTNMAAVSQSDILL